jgi:hypothetical protein
MDESRRGEGESFGASTGPPGEHDGWVEVRQRRLEQRERGVAASDDDGGADGGERAHERWIADHDASGGTESRSDAVASSERDGDHLPRDGCEVDAAADATEVAESDRADRCDLARRSEQLLDAHAEALRKGQRHTQRRLGATRFDGRDRLAAHASQRCKLLLGERAGDACRA